MISSAWTGQAWTALAWAVPAWAVPAWKGGWRLGCRRDRRRCSGRASGDRGLRRSAGAADVAGVVSQSPATPHHAAWLETVVGSQQLTATYDAALENMRLDFTFRSDDITVQGDLAAVRGTSQGSITIRATGETQPARLDNCSFWNARGRWKIAHYMDQLMPEQQSGGAAPASSESATRIGHCPSSAGRRLARRSAAVMLVYLPHRGRAGRRATGRGWRTRRCGRWKGCHPGQAVTGSTPAAGAAPRGRCG